MFVAYLFIKLFFVLVPLNFILGASRFENFLVFLWKCRFGGHRFENSFLALLVLKIVFCRFLKIFCACSCEDVSCARGFEHDIMSLSALKILLRIELKHGTLKVSKPLICEDEKKFDFTFYLLLERISQLNFIYAYIRLLDSTTSIFLES